MLESEIPDEFTDQIKAMAKRMAQRYRKQRQRARIRTCADANVENVRNQRLDRSRQSYARVEFDDLVGTATKSDFERQTVLVEIGEHPRFGSFRELAHVEFDGSQSAAYRIRSTLFAELADLLHKNNSS